jgi:hypothetical protein
MRVAAFVVPAVWGGTPALSRWQKKSDLGMEALLVTGLKKKAMSESFPQPIGNPILADLSGRVCWASPSPGRASWEFGDRPAAAHILHIGRRLREGRSPLAGHAGNSRELQDHGLEFTG